MPATSLTMRSMYADTALHTSMVEVRERSGGSNWGAISGVRRAVQSDREGSTRSIRRESGSLAACGPKLHPNRAGKQPLLRSATR